MRAAPSSLLVAGCLGALLGVGCTGPRKGSNLPAEAVIGTDGGELTVALPEGSVVVRLPPGAVAEPIRVTARHVAPIPGAASAVVELGPHEVPFPQPVEVEFRLGEGGGPRLIPPSLLRVATRENDRWRFLPTTSPRPRTYVASVQHFSPFALLAPCLVAGTGTQFPLVGCAAHNPVITTSTPVELMATAGLVSLWVTLFAKPSAASPIMVTVSGLSPGSTYYLRVDGLPSTTLVANAIGAVQFAQDVTSEHLLLVSSLHGSVTLDPTACSGALGTYDPATTTCRLARDIPDAEVTIVASDFTLDCLGHTLGSSTMRRNFGVEVVNRARVTVRNCEILNVDVGVKAQGAERLTVEAVSVRATPASIAGTTAFSQTSGHDSTYSNLAVEAVDKGLEVFNVDRLHVQAAAFRTTSTALLLFNQTDSVADDVEVDGVLKTSAPVPGGPLAAVILDEMFKSASPLAKSRLGGLKASRMEYFEAAVAVLDSRDFVVTGAAITGALSAIRVGGGPGTSVVVSDSTLKGKFRGIELLGGGGVTHVFHNNIFSSMGLKASSPTAVELSDTRAGEPTFGQGNYWGRTCTSGGALFVAGPGAGADSNQPIVVDSHPYDSPSGWATGLPPGCNSFAACTPINSPSGQRGHWPDPNNPRAFGTQKWEFDWQVGLEGIEVSDVHYTATLGGPMKMVMRRGSLPFLPALYPVPASTCQYNSEARVYADAFTKGQPTFCCGNVPTTVCDEPDRTISCFPLDREITTCPVGSPSCKGVCVGTQLDTAGVVEDAVGEVASGSATADIVLATTFAVGYYKFVQRWRFRDDGTILPSIRLGAINNCQLHTHQIYFRFNFELVEPTAGFSPSEVIQQCDNGRCPDIGNARWSPELNCTCGTRPQPNDKTSWRVSDTHFPGRSVVINSGVNEGVASTYCENTNGQCLSKGIPCVNTHDFCALAASEPQDFLVSSEVACNDHLADQVGQPGCSSLSTGTDSVFWYFAHADNHDPCTYLAWCDPAPGDVAFGPTIRLVGTW